MRARRQQIREQRVGVLDDAAEQASETETLADDQRIANRKVAFWTKQVRIVRQLVRDRKATAEELEQVLDDLDDAEDAARDIRRDRRAQRRENRQERLELKIQIAQDNGNVKAEIAAREAQIKNTQALIRQTRKGSLQRLRLIAQLRREQRELRELKEEKEKATEDAKAVIFAFMQAQQGFAANLLSNLVPFELANNTLGAAGARTPGGTRPGDENLSLANLPAGAQRGANTPVTFPGDALSREATVQAASKPQQGFTNTQVNRLLALQAQVVSLLGGRVNKDAHPHAKTAKKAGGSGRTCCKWLT